MWGVSSRNTSVNTTKLPAVYNAIKWDKLQDTFGELAVFDYGCGRRTDHIRSFLQRKGIDYYITFDPYWESDVGLNDFEKLLKNCKTRLEAQPVIVCSNVLNVISEWDKEVLAIKKYFLDSKQIYFVKVYEGDKSGQGRITKEDCWQWNKPAKDYITSPFEVVYKGIITCPLYTRFL